jgi:hypothetical protein
MHLPQMWDDCPPSTRGSLLPGELPKLRNPDGPKIRKPTLSRERICPSTNIAALPAEELPKSGKGSGPEGILWSASTAGTGT